ncbi:hypothetical protein LXA43DRAFT_1065564 [Ganoderma leucocontextum]|nr:hypothetical protein LXA43DRAFT_1065564 [Ganoderma leucocontextum]
MLDELKTVKCSCREVEELVTAIQETQARPSITAPVGTPSNGVLRKCCFTFAEDACLKEAFRGQELAGSVFSVDSHTDDEPEIDDDEEEFEEDEILELPMPEDLFNLPRIGEEVQAKASGMHYARNQFYHTGAPQVIVIVDTTGVHELPVVFCTCQGAEPLHLQLLTMGLYPATTQCPHTAFTFRVLDDFLLTNKECKISCMAYYSKLRRIMNDAFPHMVPDRYRDLLCVSRQWCNVKAWKQNSVGYSDNLAPTSGGRALACPACLRPKVNLPDGWENDPDQWKYMASVIIDGNFSAEHQHMKNPWDDVRLADRHGFMVTNTPYKAHLETAVQYRQKLRCHKHRAVLAAAAERAPLEATGIGATACSHYGFFCPHSVVDFQWGEHPGLFLPANFTVLGGISQFHVHGHRHECYSRYSPNFVFGAGWQLSEVIESLWSAPNKISDSIRGMTIDHRQEVIDDHFNDSNWNKLIGLLIDPDKVKLWLIAADTATQEHRNNIKVMDIYEVHAEKLPSRCEVQLKLSHIKNSHATAKQGAAAWLAMGLTIEETRLHVAAKARKINPQTAALGDQLMLENMRGKLLNQIKKFNRKAALFLPASALPTALGLPANESDLRRQWDSLDQDPPSHHLLGPTNHALPRTVRQNHSNPPMPRDQSEDDDDNDNDIENPGAPLHAAQDLPAVPERLSIPLPSSLGARFCCTHGLRDLMMHERSLRLGQMNDALHHLHVGIGYKLFLYHNSVQVATSQRQKLRSFDEVHMTDAAVMENARIYASACTSLSSLYDVQVTEDMAELDSLLSRSHRAGYSWSVQVALVLDLELDVKEDSQGVKWMEEMYRVIWLCAHARRSCWEEELTIVPLEMA